MRGYTIQNSINLLEKEKGGGAGGTSSAADVSFDNTGTGLAATNVQSALSEIDTRGNYTTTKTRIGTWTDGSPIYRQVFILETPVTLSNQNWVSTGIATADLNFKELLNAACGNTKVVIPCALGGDDTYINLYSVMTEQRTCNRIIIDFIENTSAKTRKKK